MVVHTHPPGTPQHGESLQAIFNELDSSCEGFVKRSDVEVTVMDYMREKYSKSPQVVEEQAAGLETLVTNMMQVTEMKRLLPVPAGNRVPPITSHTHSLSLLRNARTVSLTIANFILAPDYFHRRFRAGIVRQRPWQLSLAPRRVSSCHPLNSCLHAACPRAGTRRTRMT